MKQRHLFRWTISIVLTGLSVIGLLAGCSLLPKGEATLDLGIKDRGVASWYGVAFHGRTSANGEPFDMDALTAAHRTLPLGSVVRVVNVINGKYVRVKINDRGPYIPGRMLDLSYAAAVELGMVRGGTSVVQIEVVGDRRFDMLLSADRRMELSGAILLHEDSERPRPAPLTSRESLLRGTRQAEGARLPPSDMLHARRARRVASIMAAEHSVYKTVVPLLVA